MHRRLYRAFTLIELLVVVAILALLISILLPSLSRAREQGKMIVCQSNMRQLNLAFLSLAFESKGRLPGTSYDTSRDWLGSGNPGGRQPQDGLIYKFMGNQAEAYRCPSDTEPRLSGVWTYSYTANSLLSGALPEWVRSAHYRDETGTRRFNANDHRQNLVLIQVPLLVEEDYKYHLTTVTNSAWDNADSITNRHMKRYGNLGYVDGATGKVQLPPVPRTNVWNYFDANRYCIRTKGNKLVSGMQWSDASQNGAYGYLARAPHARTFNVFHVAGDNGPQGP